MPLGLLPSPGAAVPGGRPSWSFQRRQRKELSTSSLYLVTVVITTGRAHLPAVAAGGPRAAHRRRHRAPVEVVPLRRSKHMSKCAARVSPYELYMGLQVAGSTCTASESSAHSVAVHETARGVT